MLWPFPCVVVVALEPAPGDGVARLCVRPGALGAREREPGELECVLLPREPPLPDPDAPLEDGTIVPSPTLPACEPREVSRA